jgi:hypothetical protein
MRQADFGVTYEILRSISALARMGKPRCLAMKITLPVRAILKPSSLSMIAVFASFAAWLCPTFGVLHKGFDNPSKLDFPSAVVLLSWYLLIFTSFVVGQKAGGLAVFQKNCLNDKLFDLESNSIYYILTLIGGIGLAAMLFGIFRSLSLQEAILQISLGQTNTLKEALYEDYSIGVVSLRYVILFPSSLALYRIIRSKDYSPINLLNVLMLAVLAFLSFRLILIAVLVTTLFLLNYGRRSVRVNPLKILSFAALIFVILSALNISRNAAYYYGQLNLSFGVAGINEVIAYLSTPFQAAIALARYTDQLAAGGVDAYRNYVVLDINYMTNSAFVHLNEQLGPWAWLYIATICSFMGFVFEALASLGKTVFLLPCGAILYGSAELWRLDLFHQGGFIVWFVIGIGVPAIFLLARNLGRYVYRFGSVPGDSWGQMGKGGPDVQPGKQ